jgi:hypothetical protein
VNFANLRPVFKRGRSADRIINRARQRYRQLAPTARPGPQSHNLLGLFSPQELCELTLARRWPLSLADLAWVTGRKAEPDAAFVGRLAGGGAHA